LYDTVSFFRVQIPHNLSKLKKIHLIHNSKFKQNKMKTAWIWPLLIKICGTNNEFFLPLKFFYTQISQNR
jgi:hypothetical protein